MDKTRGLNRREFIGIAASAAGMVAAALPLESEVLVNDQRRIRAIAFDGFVIFDSRAVAKRVEEVLPDKASDFVNLWRTRQFEYTWLRTAGQQYEDFWRVTKDALNYAEASLKIALTVDQRDRLMNIYRELPVWPDVPEALAALRRRGIKLAFLSNLTKAMLDSNLAKTKLSEFFEEHLTTDRVRFYKPSPRAYQMGVDSFHLKRDEIAFTAFGAWDAAGAKWFGYPTVWVNRANATMEELGVQPDVISPDMSGLIKFVGQ